MIDSKRRPSAMRRLAGLSLPIVMLTAALPGGAEAALLPSIDYSTESAGNIVMNKMQGVLLGTEDAKAALDQAEAPATGK